MRLPDHARRDRIAVAQLRGTVQRHAGRDSTTGEAVTELHGITTDPHLLAHATTSRDRRIHGRVVGLLLAAGADPQALEQAQAEVDANNASGGLGAFAQRMNTNTWRQQVGTQKQPPPEGGS